MEGKTMMKRNRDFKRFQLYKDTGIRSTEFTKIQEYSLQNLQSQIQNSQRYSDIGIQTLKKYRNIWSYCDIGIQTLQRYRNIQSTELTKIQKKCNQIISLDFITLLHVSSGFGQPKDRKHYIQYIQSGPINITVERKFKSRL